MSPQLPTGIHLVDQPEEFRSRLLSWFEREGRSLPWRRDRSLYGTWVSEMMLQQTTVSVVEPYWLRFMARFPDVRSLAAAPEEEVLSHWSGLGYYRRARHLHAAAVRVVEDLGGELPGDREAWLDLPGVGPYASGAISSIGLGLREPAIDANARRVLSRWLLSDPVLFPELKSAHLDAVGRELVDPHRPGDWNEALMELGALVCVAGSPRCGNCPMGELCRAGKARTAEKIPPPKTSATTIPVELALLVVLWNDRILLMPPDCPPVAQFQGNENPVRGNLKGLLGGLWGLPAGPWLPRSDQGATQLEVKIWKPFIELLSTWQDVDIKEDPVLVGSFPHAITKYRLNVRVYGIRLPEIAGTREGAPRGDEPDIRGWTVELDLEKRETGPGPVARFCRWPRPRHPVSNLVAKSMAQIAKSSV